MTYSPAELDVQRLVDEGLAAAAVDVLEVGIEAVAGVASGTAVGRGVMRTVGGVNSRLEQATGGALRLRDAFPLTLFALGIRKVLQGNLQPVPWYNLLYYGYSTFAALHGRRGSASQPQAAEPDAVELLRRRFARGEISTDQFREMLVELGAPMLPETREREDGSGLVESDEVEAELEQKPGSVKEDPPKPRRRRQA